MLASLAWLALEVKDLEPALAFYHDRLQLPIIAESATETTVAAGDTAISLRPPGPVPRGGLHTHYAFSIPFAEYDTWWTTLSREFDLVEHTFGRARSMYLYDPDGNCVELGQQEEGGSGITGVFEVVLEVENLERANRFYSRLGGRVIDRGTDRRRVRIDLGPVDLELWEPQLGLADARGGVHVDLGFDGDSETMASAVAELADEVTWPSEDEVLIRDPDGHAITVRG